ncbi:hypothetical protein PT974_09953 [Cladobotryum mycophilum]|uniref:Uncharacterized protein n=1 Tax=Cladobotryum mycophilum TaxID=491253 RepID=A0ABR0S9L4_9HYPO
MRWLDATIKLLGRNQMARHHVASLAKDEDAANKDALLRTLDVEDGTLTTPDGNVVFEVRASFLPRLVCHANASISLRSIPTKPKRFSICRVSPSG